jgi:ABC-type lipoprotein release transport system permease subunit
LIASVAAAVLVIGATAFAVVAGARRREGELAALRAIGIPPGSLRRSLEAEMGLVLGTGLLLGTIAGLVAAVFALKSVPEVAASLAGPPLEMGLPGIPLVITLAVLVLVLGATVRLGAEVFVRSASAETLGGTQA